MSSDYNIFGKYYEWHMMLTELYHFLLRVGSQEDYVPLIDELKTILKRTEEWEKKSKSTGKRKSS